jgi:hypothetical protein
MLQIALWVLLVVLVVLYIGRRRSRLKKENSEKF